MSNTCYNKDGLYGVLARLLYTHLAIPKPKMDSVGRFISVPKESVWADLVKTLVRRGVISKTPFESQFGPIYKIEHWSCYV